MKRAPRNTERDVTENPWPLIVEGMVIGPSEAIEAQEARGQHEFVESTTLPTGMSAEDRTVLQSWGVKFLGAVPDDPLFHYVELPPGWKRVPTEHAMHSNLVDDVGTTRAHIFYKAAFYDRRASLHLAAAR